MAKFKGWERKPIKTRNTIYTAITPLIITASRSTDIPAFYAEWFINRLKAGYIKWINPFNHRPLYVSLDSTRLIVFWSKNPAPIFNYLPIINEKGVNYYFQFTLNNYEEEGLEPNVPTIENRIESFRELSRMIGKKRIIWRYDPLILTPAMNVNSLLDKVKRIGDAVNQFTEKLVISFIDINKYKSVAGRLAKNEIYSEEFTPKLIRQTAEGISKLNTRWGLEVSTCAEPIDLSQYGISHNRCVDDKLIRDAFPEDKRIISFLDEYEVNRDWTERIKTIKHPLKDKGQRSHCGCIVSKDIGQYNTCGHLCLYCYANQSNRSVRDNMRRHFPTSDSIIPDQ
jgi:DNA repair photolyase